MKKKKKKRIIFKGQQIPAAVNCPNMNFTFWQHRAKPEESETSWQRQSVSTRTTRQVETGILVWIVFLFSHLLSPVLFFVSCFGLNHSTELAQAVSGMHMNEFRWGFFWFFFKSKPLKKERENETDVCNDSVFGQWLKCFVFQGSDEDFEKVYEQCLRCCKAFLEKNS